MPGVIVETNVRSGPSGAGEVREAQAFFAGKAERGPVTAPVLVRGVSEYVTFFGGYEPGNLFADIKTFFEEGGDRAYVYRVLDSAASTAEITLEDGSSVPTLMIQAANPGAWGNNLSVAVIDGDAPNTFKIQLYLDGVLQYTTRDLTDPEDAANLINTSAVNHLIVATDLGSPTIPPTPDNITATPLAGGSNGSDPGESDYIDALDLFTYDLGVGAVAIPGQSGTGIWNALIAHAKENNRIALLAFGENDSQDTVKTSVSQYYSHENAEYGAFYYPWIQIPDPATNGLRINISPEAYAAAARAKAITLTGPWRAGAGLISESSFVNGVLEDLNREEANLLDEKRINAIRRIGNSFRIYGARSVDSDEDNWRWITHRDTINFIVSRAEERLEDFVFQTIDARGALFARIEGALIGLLDPIRVAGGLFEAFDIEGNQVDPGYSVEVSDVINPVASLQRGIVSARVGVRVSSISDTIFVTVTKSNLVTSVT